jgi:hypothetical protein
MGTIKETEGGMKGRREREREREIMHQIVINWEDIIY